MDTEKIKEYVHSREDLPFLQKDKRNKGYICPCCNNGSGSTGDGIVKIPLSNSYKCFKCGLSGDAFFWIGKAFGISGFMRQAEEAARCYGLDFEGAKDISKDKTPAKASGGSYSERNASESDYILRCHNMAKNTDYFALRGISSESTEKFMLGYDPDFREGTGGYSWKAVIIPTSEASYEARNTGISANSKESSGFKCRKHGRSRIFNGKALAEEKEKPVFITEGCFDALSIIQCGGQAAALGGVSNISLLMKELDRVTPSVPLVIAFDNDDAGREAAVKISAELDKRGCAYIDGSEVSGEYHDPNDRLINDISGLEAAVKELTERALTAGSPSDRQRDEYLSNSVRSAIPLLREYIAKSAARPGLSTGFYQVDKALGGGIYTGLYVIGAVSSLGKTTFTLQVADNLAKAGNDVLFFSLEQSRFDLMAKSISRESFGVCRRQKLDTSNAKSSLSVLNGRRAAAYSDVEKYVVDTAFSNYEKYSEHLFIYEGIGNITVSEIKDKVKAHTAYTGCRYPVVFVDYLQILKAAEGDERASDKQITDRNITYLKQLSRDFDIPVIAVSSLNRQNYSERINMAAFKESGAIEYGSDVLIGLQLKGAGEKDFDINAAKAKDPREVEFIVLKNRNGAVSREGVQLNYYPMFNCFRGILDPYDD